MTSYLLGKKSSGGGSNIPSVVYLEENADHELDFYINDIYDTASGKIKNVLPILLIENGGGLMCGYMIACNFMEEDGQMIGFIIFKQINSETDYVYMATGEGKFENQTLNS